MLQKADYKILLSIQKKNASRYMVFSARQAFFFVPKHLVFLMFYSGFIALIATEQI